MPRPTAPPLLPGTLTPTFWDHLRIVWWHEQGFIRGCSRGTWRERARAATLALLWWPSLGAVLAVKLWRSTRPNRTEYLSPTRDAVITIVAKQGGLWVIEDHVRRQRFTSDPDGRKDRGTGKGGKLRHLIAAPLLTHADAHSITIEATAATEKLARIYMTELVGMEATTATTPSGRIQLRRLPHPVARVSALDQADEPTNSSTP